MRRSQAAWGVALTCAAAAGAVAAVSLTGAPSAPAAIAPGMTVAKVVRTNLAATVLTEGTLGYRPTAPVINAMSGTYTWLPRPGRVIPPGGTLYRVDDLPVVLMAGPVPAWRSFQLGMTAGPDVRELQQGLIAGHFADGRLIAPTGEFTVATTIAVERWQAAHGYSQTGQIPLGQILFLPGRVRVGGWQVATGQLAAAGQQPYLVDSDRRIVTVPVTPGMPTVRVGQRVSIILPSQISTPGRVTSIGPPPAADAASQQPGGSSQGGSSPTPSSVLTVSPAQPGSTGTGTAVPVQVSLTIQSVRGVLAVPVAALLALAGGGYGLEVVLPSGAHKLVGVRTGVFAGGRVQVSGGGLVPGTTVVTAQ
ncbi:MAG: peptidoglycan-binding domain-containing protein [Streptosporangiaceae bacterium]